MTKVLLVDDERGLRTTLRAFLELDGYDVSVAETAMEALDILASNPADIVVSDIILPRMTGIELLREIKARYPQTRVILITGEPTVSTATTAVREGAFDYLDKPITKEKILQVVRAATSAGPNPPRAVCASDEVVPPMISRYLSELPDFIWEMDLNFRYSYVSPAVEAMTGYSMEEVLTRSPKERMTPDAAELVEKALQEELVRELEGAPKRRMRTLELKLRHKNGSLVPVEVVASFLRDESGQPTGIIGITRDVTVRSQRQREEFEAQCLEERSVRMRSMARLAGGVAHDLNNLLTSVSGNVALAMMDAEGNPAVMESLEEIKKVAARANELTSNLLEFSQRQSLGTVLTDIGNLLGNLRQKYEEVLGRSRSLVLQLPGDVLRSPVDPVRLETSLHEIIKNATDATEPGGVVTIGLSSLSLDEHQARHLALNKPGEYLVLTVRDTGKGIEAADLPFIFEPYFTTKPKGKGKGLGLARVFGNLRQMGGGVHVLSQPGLGTTVELYLPRNPEDSQEITAPAASSTRQSILGGTETILCVDDDEVVRDMTIRTLKRRGYHILQAGDGVEAVQLVEVYRQPIHLLLTDLVMPRMGGAEAATEIVSLRPDIKVLFTSGFTDKPINFSGKKQVDFLPKPYDAHSLSAAVRRVLDSDQ